MQYRYSTKYDYSRPLIRGLLWLTFSFAVGTYLVFLHIKTHNDMAWIVYPPFVIFCIFAATRCVWWYLHKHHGVVTLSDDGITLSSPMWNRACTWSNVKDIWITHSYNGFLHDVKGKFFCTTCRIRYGIGWAVEVDDTTEDFPEFLDKVRKIAQDSRIEVVEVDYNAQSSHGFTWLLFLLCATSFIFLGIYDLVYLHLINVRIISETMLGFMLLVMSVNLIRVKREYRKRQSEAPPASS